MDLEIEGFIRCNFELAAASQTMRLQLTSKAVFLWKVKFSEPWKSDSVQVHCTAHDMSIQGSIGVEKEKTN